MKRLFLMASLLTLGHFVQAAPRCEDIFLNPKLSSAATLDLAAKLRSMQVGYERNFSSEEIDWAAAEISSLAQRLEAGTENVYGVLGVNYSSKDIGKKPFDLSEDELKFAEWDISHGHLSADNYRMTTWLLHRLFPVSQNVVSAAKVARTDDELKLALAPANWASRLSADGSLITFSQNESSPGITVVVGESIPFQERKDLAAAVESGRAFMTSTAKILNVKEVRTSNDWHILEDAGFEKKVDSTRDVVVFTNERNHGRIVLPDGIPGAPVMKYNEQDRVGFYKASLNGETYIHPSIKNKLH